MKRRIVFLLLIVVAVGLGLLFLWPGYAKSFIASHECAYCHQLHGAPGFALLKETQIETLCLTCHGPGGTSTLKADVHTNDKNSNYLPFRISCRVCHDPHDNLPNWLGGTNIKLVGSEQDTTGYARITYPVPDGDILDVVYESRGTDAGEPSLHSFADNDENGDTVYDGVCETCHTLTGHHRNNPSEDHSHHVGETCTRCHAHLDGFLR